MTVQYLFPEGVPFGAAVALPSEGWAVGLSGTAVEPHPDSFAPEPFP